MMKSALGPDAVLHVGREQQTFPTGQNPGADDAIKRARAEREIVAADPLGEIRIAQPMRIARREFDASKHRPGEGELFLELLINP